MSQPTGEHASGVKLASAYVDVTAHTKDGGQEVHQMLQGVEDHSKVVGENSAQNIVSAMKAAGPQAATALGTGLASETSAVTKAAATHADSYTKTFKDAIHNTRMSEDLEYLLGKNDDLIKSYGGVHGESYMQRFLQVMAGHAADAQAAGEKTGEAVGAGAIASLDRGGLKDYISRMQSWKIEAQRSVLDIGQTYAQMASAGSYSLDQLKEKHEELAAAQAKVKEGSLNIADAQNRLRGLGAITEDVGGGLLSGEAFRKASEGVAQLGGKFGEVGEAAGGMGEKMSGALAPLAMFATPEVLGIGAVLGLVGAVGEVVNKVNELGETWENLGHTIEIQTGATGEHLEELKGQVGDVYKGVTNSMGDVANIVSAVNTVFKDSGKGAEDVSKQIANLSAMTGQVNVDSLGMAFKGFNIGGDAAQQQSVIDGLLRTAQDTRTPVNDLISSMQRIAPTMDAAHISMKDTLAMFDEFGQAGIKPQQTFFLMNKAAADATKTGKDFHTVLTDTIAAIKNAPSEQEAEKIAKGVFGPSSARGGATVAVQAIRSGNLNLDPAALAGLENWDGLVNKTRQDTMTWHDQWTLFTHNMSVSLRPVSEELHEKVQGALDNVVAWFGAHQDQITHFATTIVDGFEKGATVIGKFAQEALPAIHQVIDYLEPAFKNLEPHIQKLGQALLPLAESLGKDVLPIVKALGEAFIWALNEAMKLLPPVVDALTDVVKVVTGISDKMRETFGPNIRKETDQFKKDIGTIKDVAEDVGKAFKVMGEVVHDAFEGIKAPVMEVYDAVKKVVELLDKIPDVKDLEHGHFTHHAEGGAVHGQTGLALGGYGGGDIVPALLEPGEHVATKEEIRGVGGHDNFYAIRELMRSGMLREMLGFQDGGAVTYDKYGRPIPQQHQEGSTGLPMLDLFGKLLHALGFQGGGDVSGDGTRTPTAQWGSGPWWETPVQIAGDLALPFLPSLIWDFALGSIYPSASTASGDTGAGEKYSKAYDDRLNAQAAERANKAGGWRAWASALGFQTGGAIPEFTGQGWDPNTQSNIGGFIVNKPKTPEDMARVMDYINQIRTFTYANQQIAGANIPGTAALGSGVEGTHLADIWSGGIGVNKNWEKIPGGQMLFGGVYDQARHASGGAVHPASGGGSEHGWVIDRYKLAKPKPLHFQGGGEVGEWGGLADVKALLAAESGRTPYAFGGYSPRGIDCSGLVAQAVEIYLGLPMSGGHPMDTGNEGSWLAAHGFQQGLGPAGSFRVAFYNGGPGGGHTALTLPDGTNAESGGSGGGVRLGGGAAGADSSEFTDHWFLPPREVVSPAGYGGTGGGGSGGYGGAGGGSGGSGGGYGGAGGGDSAAAAGLGGGAWDDVAAAESGGNWSNQDTGHTGHFGGLQFSPDTWKAYGGTGNPADASREEQIKIANRVAFTGWNGKPPQGLGAWQAISQGKVPGITTSSPASAFGGTDLGGGGGATEEQLVAGRDRITAATNRLNEAEAKLKKDRDDGKSPEQIAKDEDHVTEARNKLNEATLKLQELQNKPGKQPKGERGAREGGAGGGEGKGGDSMFGDLFGIGYKGVQEQLPEGFSNPLEWGVTKSASALFKFFGAMLGGDGKGAAESLIGGGRGGRGGGQVSPYVQSLMAQVPGYQPQSGGNQTTINRNVTYTGPIQDGTQQSDDALGARQILNSLRLVTGGS